MTTNNYAKRTKWVEATYHFVRHAVRHGIVRLEVISSAEDVADTLTRPSEEVYLNAYETG